MLEAEKLEVHQLVEEYEAGLQEWRANLTSLETEASSLPQAQGQLEDEDEDSEDERPLYIEYIPINETLPKGNSESPQTMECQGAFLCGKPKRCSTGTTAPS